ncbi:MAG: hypothetical protein V1672_02840 [Candidatus Diapherotrites archaeon]
MGVVREFGNIFMSSFWAVISGFVFFIIGTVAAAFVLSGFFGLDPVKIILTILVVVLSILFGLFFGSFMGKMIFKFRRKRTRPNPDSDFGYATIRVSEAEKYR